ncbi:TPA: zinc-ribbon domain-containing protein [Candidatus Bathyarchaeota archaeon]|nr:zinc-ribbon domain-containing protein [Candidatus Bathyarchaeota archaeon]
MPFCPECGTPVKVENKFCPYCGYKLEPVAAPQQRQAAYPPQQAQETIRVLIPNLMKSKSLGRTDTYNLIVTNKRSIFAKLTQQIMNETVNKRRAKAEAEGKGFFGKWKAQMQGFNTYTDWYADKTPDYTLGETQGNWAVENSAISNVRVNESKDEESGIETYYIEFTTPTGKFDFSMQYDPHEMLAKAYGGVMR